MEDHLDDVGTESVDAQREREAREAWQRRQREMDDNYRRQEAEEQEYKRLIIPQIRTEAHLALDRLEQAGYPDVTQVEVVTGYTEHRRWFQSHLVQQTATLHGWRLGRDGYERRGVGVLHDIDYLMTNGELREYRPPKEHPSGMRLDNRIGLHLMILENKDYNELRVLLETLKDLG